MLFSFFGCWNAIVLACSNTFGSYSNTNTVISKQCYVFYNVHFKVSHLCIWACQFFCSKQYTHSSIHRRWLVRRFVDCCLCVYETIYNVLEKYKKQERQQKSIFNEIVVIVCPFVFAFIVSDCSFSLHISEQGNGTQTYAHKRKWKQQKAMLFPRIYLNMHYIFN